MLTVKHDAARIGVSGSLVKAWFNLVHSRLHQAIFGNTESIAA